MLLRFLSITALALRSFTVSAEDPDLYSAPSLSPAQPYHLNLSCAECAFSYGDCSENIHPNSFLAITFSTQDDSLLANGDVIFPSPNPMQFHAKRHWASSFESVPLAYELDIQPLPHQPGAILGDLYRLKLTLMDLQGRPATVSPVTVGFIRSDEGRIEIIEVEESSYHRYHRQLSQGKGTGSWWRMKTWKSWYINYLHRTSKTKPCAANSTSHIRATSDCRAHDRLTDWAGDRHYLKLVRPAVLPALLGLTAGIVACVIGFLIGKVIVAVYYYRRDRRALALTDPESDIEEDVRSEKERLMDMYGHPADSNSIHSL
ncbi:hypothetical protein BDW59DRAFT_9990 [Aspergillus cavernicola]|uniref:Uncharacterized protein n=1 Tax=Aspergillus cavernicola TaxID=176166 RepID=A0ABR4HLQ7_9EURO